jgi:type VI protein secretion system component VasF
MIPSPLTTRLIHVVTFDTATELLAMVGLCLPAAEQKTVFDAFYSRIRQGIEQFEREREEPAYAGR